MLFPEDRQDAPRFSAVPATEGRLSENTPLARLLGVRQREPDFRRVRRLARLFRPFHLKYTVTTEVRGRVAVINGRQVINYGSANYLGLEQHPEVIAASKRALDGF